MYRATLALVLVAIYMVVGYFFGGWVASVIPEGSVMEEVLAGNTAGDVNQLETVSLVKLHPLVTSGFSVSLIAWMFMAITTPSRKTAVICVLAISFLPAAAMMALFDLDLGLGKLEAYLTITLLGSVILLVPTFVGMDWYRYWRFVSRA